MMELIDDDDVEVTRLKTIDVFLGDRLDHGEDVTTRGSATAAVDLAERPVAEDRPKCRPALLQDALAVRYEEQRKVSSGAPAQLSVVERRHHGLAGSRGGHDEVAMPSMPLALEHQPFEHALLMRVRMNIEPDE